MHQIANYWI